jgi:CDGSH-type Zn-finger protein
MPDGSEARRPRIRGLADGPLVYDRGDSPRGRLLDATRADVSAPEKVLLCRCGASGNKPFCDGSHAAVGFSSAKVWKAGAGHRIDHVGRKITIHDNRVLCAHVEYCVQGLPAVFDRSRTPWIDPDAASVEEIVATIERCPSGALSYSIDGVEHRDLDRPPAVVTAKNGPYLVEGGVELLDEVAAPDASAEHYTLCRCGASHNKPFCDGKHWNVHFEDGQPEGT